MLFPEQTRSLLGLAFAVFSGGLIGGLLVTTSPLAKVLLCLGTSVMLYFCALMFALSLLNHYSK